MSKANRYCVDCGKKLTKEERDDPYNPDGEGPVCYTCETEEYSDTCPICGELKRMDAFDDDVFAVFDVIAFRHDHGTIGIYRALTRPYYTQPLIGHGWLDEYAIERVNDVPQKTQYDGLAPCATLCDECAAPYLKPEAA